MTTSATPPPGPPIRPLGHAPTGDTPPGYPPVAYPPTGYTIQTVAPNGRPLAAFSDRLIARVIDSAILSGAALVLILPIMLIVVFATLPTQSDGQATPEEVLAVLGPLFALTVGVWVLIIALSYLYEVELMFRGGQTLGKRIAKIKVIPLDPSLVLTRGMAAKRFLVTTGCGIVPFLGLLDGLWQLWDKPYQQCLHDKVPSTVVIKLDS